VARELGQGGQDRERQSREREIKFFAEIAMLFCPKNKRSLKKNGLRLIRSVFLSLRQAFSKNKNKKKGLRRIRSVFLSQKHGSGYKSQGGGQKSHRWGQNISRGAASPLPLYFPRLCVNPFSNPVSAPYGKFLATRLRHTINLHERYYAQ